MAEPIPLKLVEGIVEYRAKENLERMKKKKKWDRRFTGSGPATRRR
jgi:hypothetical protein